MKSRTLTCITAMALFAAVAMPNQVAVQGQNQQPPRYTVTDIGTLGGTFGEANAVNNKGWVVGDATLPGDRVRHAFLWRKGLMKDLGTLGGPNSIALFPLNERGEITGFSDTSTPDPLGEDFCGFGTNLICLPFLWQHGVMTPLPTLGGNNGQALEVNNRGQVVGIAENTTPDATCIGTPQTPQFEPLIWQKGEVRALPTFSSDPDGVANAINDKGDAVGQTGDCTNPFHAVLWHNGTPTDLGTLGGLQLNPLDVNNRGQVVGVAFSPDGTTIVGFLWENGIATDLGTIPPDVFSVAIGINDKGQIVGDSCDEFFDCRAFLWQNGTMTELNSLIRDPNAPFLENANSINSRGQIAGKTTVQGTPIADAFLASPNHGQTTDETAAPRETTETRKATLPENVSKMLRQRLGFRDRYVRSPHKLMNGTAVISGPKASLSPSSLTFSTQAIGTTSAAKTVMLKNTGTAGLTITSIAITGTNAVDFLQTHTCGSSLAAGASCSISVTFKPKATGTRTAALSVSDNAAGSPQNVSLSGIGTTAKLSPTSLTFSAQLVGTTSPAKTVTLTNVGTTSLNITSIAITGTNVGNFAQTHTCGGSLAAGASCTISVTFKPTAPGTRRAALSISDSAAGSPQKASLSGTGIVSGPNATLSPTSLIFADQLVGTTSPGKSVTLSNYGTMTLSITSITTSGDFSQTHTCGSSLTPLASCTISVTFKPTQIGTRSGTLSITDNGGGSPQSVALSGTGVVSGPNATLSPSKLIFACRNIVGDGCQCITGNTTTLSDFGTTTLSITGITITGDFSQTNNCDTSVGAGKSCTISVKWSPLATSFGAVSVSDNASGSPQTVSLEGLKECTPP
jgi:probable HAF family extracellular repeat protein